MEGVNSRLKEQVKLNDILGRGKFKVRVHAVITAIVLQLTELCRAPLARQLP